MTTIELKKAKINFLGDNITEGHSTSAPEKMFSELLAAQYGIVARNYGIGGTRIAYQQTPSAIPQCDLNFIDRVSQMDPDADAVVVFGGTNDFGTGDAPLGCMEDRSPYTFYGALHTLYSTLITRYPTAKIVVLTPLHRCSENDPKGDGDKTEGGAPLKRYVEIIREVAEYYSLPVLDLFKTSGMQPLVPIIKEWYMPDGLHPNDAGHVLLADRIAGFLKTL